MAVQLQSQNRRHCRLTDILDLLMILAEFGNNDSTDHTVVVVDKEGYDTCGKSGVKYDTTTVSLGYLLQRTYKESGDYYIICDISAHCLQGQKVYIQVLNEDGTINTTDTPKDPERPSAAPHQMPGFTWTSKLVIVVVSAFSLMMAAAASM
uniref:Phytocyanin domain-containing protein n=1 Tax=Physcomitrium patens TaxID=3218 RepID=A0A2K1KCB2_PHYPA|nr:hypothetical protein PHYPA_010609 [Physcomitrium patens]PNR51423.1 hypothetical protein PHYPA_010610 [Physcomitrium patens]